LLSLRRCTGRITQLEDALQAAEAALEAEKKSSEEQVMLAACAAVLARCSLGMQVSKLQRVAAKHASKVLAECQKNEDRLRQTLLATIRDLEVPLVQHRRGSSQRVAAPQEQKRRSQKRFEDKEEAKPCVLPVCCMAGTLCQRVLWQAYVEQQIEDRQKVLAQVATGRHDPCSDSCHGVAGVGNHGAEEAAGETARGEG